MKDAPPVATEKSRKIDQLRSQITDFCVNMPQNPPLAASQMDSITEDVKRYLAPAEQIEFYIHYCHCLQRLGRFTDILKVLSGVVAIHKKHRVKDDSLGTIYNIMGDALMGLNRPTDAMAYLKKATRLIKRNEDEAKIFHLLMSKARCHTELFEYSKALADLFTAEAFTMERGSDHDKYLVNLGLGNVYAECDNLDKALTYYELSAQYASQLDNKIYYATVSSNLCRIYTIRFDLEKALELSLEVLDVYKQYNYVHFVAVMMGNIGIILISLKRFDQALEYLHKALDSIQPLDNPHTFISTSLNLAESYVGLKDYDKALNILSAAVGIAEQTEGHEMLEPIHDLFCKIYSANNQWELALKHQKAATEAKFRSISYDKEAQIKTMEQEFELKRKKHESEIYRLKNVELKKKNKLINLQKEQLETALEDLQLALDNKTKLFSIVAHDLRSPLSSLYQGIELAMTSEIADDEKDEFMAELHHSAFSVYSMTDNLLRWAGKQLNSIVNNPIPIEVFPICKNIIQQHQLLILAKHIKLAQEIDAHLPAIVDPGLWSVVFRNLLSNAIKFTPPNGTIRICIEPREDCYCCTISNSGKEISPQELPYLFNPAKNKPSKAQRSDSGIGLGLILVKEFVEMMGGTIAVDSTVGKGSDFSFTFPIDPRS